MPVGCRRIARRVVRIIRVRFAFRAFVVCLCVRLFVMRGVRGEVVVRGGCLRSRPQRAVQEPSTGAASQRRQGDRCADRDPARRPPADFAGRGRLRIRVGVGFLGRHECLEASGRARLQAAVSAQPE